MNSIEASKYIKEMFNTYWKAKGFKAYYQNIPNTKTKESKPYAQVGVYHTHVKRETYNGFNGKAKYSYRGVVRIKIYVPSNTGMDTLLTYTEEVLDLFRKPSYNCPITFTNCTFAEDFTYKEDVDAYTDFYNTEISVRFFYEKVF